jgi:hypothetical protein
MYKQAGGGLKSKREMPNIYNQKGRIHIVIGERRRRRKMHRPYGREELHTKCASAVLLIQINTKGLGLSLSLSLKRL